MSPWTYFWQGFRDVFTGRSAADAWCSFAHDGGRIKRDSLGRINWQCDKCGRWSRHPVPLGDERAATDAAERAANLEPKP